MCLSVHYFVNVFECSKTFILNAKIRIRNKVENEIWWLERSNADEIIEGFFSEKAERRLEVSSLLHKAKNTFLLLGLCGSQPVCRGI